MKTNSRQLHFRISPTSLVFLTALTVALCAIEPGAQAASMIPVQYFEEFNSDPSWEGVNNRAIPVPCTRSITQDFRYRPPPSHNAGGSAAGEIGGKIYRRFTGGYYARIIAQKTFDDTLTASGRFSVTQSTAGSAAMWGWFNSTNNTGWRQPNTLAVRLDAEAGFFRVRFEYGTKNWHGVGTGDLSFGSPPSTTHSSGNGQSYTWKLSYDPNGNGGNGQITFEIGLNTVTNTFALNLNAGDKAAGAVFDRFGMFSRQIDGEWMTVYLDDLVIDGVAEDFSSDPGWKGVGNEGVFTDCDIEYWHNFGYSPTTRAGGSPGEVGGTMYRTEDNEPWNAADSGAVVPGTLNLDDELQATGQVAMVRGTSDSALLLGWFDSTKAANAGAGGYWPTNFVGILLEGPSRLGWYFRSVYRNSVGTKGDGQPGPLIVPDGTSHAWACHYSPTANGDNGSITVTLDGQVNTLNLGAGVKTAGANFDRFGLVTYQKGGHGLEAYFDNVQYTTLQLDSNDDGIPDFWIKKAELIGADVNITFSSLLGKEYAVERKDVLHGATWSMVQDNVTGSGGDVTVVDPGGAGQSARFYRVRLLF